MKRILIAAGSLGIASLFMAAPATAEPTVGCSPLILCRIVATPGDVLAGFASTPGDVLAHAAETVTIPGRIVNTPGDVLAHAAEAFGPVPPPAP